MKSQVQKCALFVCFIFCFAINLKAQSISNYTFSASSGTYTALSGSTAPTLSGGATNDGWYNSIPIGFDFWMMGVRYNNVGASTNGWLTFGVGSTSISNAVASNSFSSNAVPKPFVAPLWDDLDFTQSLGVFSYKTTGVAPNRIFTAEWLNAEWAWSANDSVISFQIKLYESSGKIDFVYRQEANPVAGGSACIGIEGSSTSIYQSVNGTGTSPTSSTSVNTTNLNTKPATGQVYTFTPPIPSAPTNLTFTNVTQNSMTVNWTDNATNEVGYVIYVSTDSINYIFQTQLAANTTSGAMISLAASTRYFYKIYAVTEGGMSAVLIGAQTTLTGTLSGVIAIPGTYATITAAISALATSGFANSVVLELQSSYTCTGETFPINIPNNLGATSTKTITLRPATGVSSVIITSANYNGTINLNGCKYFKIDGRPGGTGTTKALTINNDVSGVSSTTTAITFINDACNDTVRYCNITGNNQYYNCGVINFGGTTAYSGNDSNCIEFCNIHAGSFANPNVLIYIYGTSGKENNSNTIANNNLYDFNGNASYSISYGIFLYSYCFDFRITGNHIYQTQSITATASSFTMYGIFMNYSAGNVTISNNYIGGSASYCAGSAWELGSVSTANRIFPVFFSGSSTLASTISGNTISNFLLATNYNSSDFYGIYASGLCNITGNTIGSSTGTGNIMVVSECVGTSYVYGINSPGQYSTISNNLVGSFDVSGTLSTHIVSLYGIVSGYYNQVTGNTITNLINETPTATLYGISSGGYNNISQNTISNLYSTNTASTVNLFGIYCPNSSDTLNRNFIHSFSVASSSASSSISGIYINSYSGTTIIKNNMINLGVKPDGTSLAYPCIIYGIYKQTNTSITLIHNSIYIGGTGVAAGAGMSACLYRNSSYPSTDIVYNNIFYNARTNSSTGGNHYNIYSPSSGNLACNCNLYYKGVPSACMIYMGYVTWTNFASYKGYGGLDSISGDADPRFVNITGNSSSVDLHINNAYATPIESFGSSTYTTTDDFDGQLRSTLTPVDVGADAGLFTQLVLPVKWLNFDALLEKNNSVLLNWSTASEINNSHFEVERKSGRRQEAGGSAHPELVEGWEVIGSVKGNGNTNTVHSYQFTDNSLSTVNREPLTIFYRLKQVDLDGKFSYSDVKVINLNTVKNDFVISPNPFTDKFDLLLPTDFNSNSVTLDIRDIQGRSIFSQNYLVQNNQTKISVETNAINSGIYFVSIISNDGAVKWQKLVKQ